MSRHAHFRVLHVVESYGGGVASAIDAYVAATPELEHHILRARREESLTADANATTFASVADLPSGPRAILAVRHALAAVRPTVMHVHSSRAGVYARLAVRNGRRVRIVYTPHCFAFERRNISWLVRACCYAIERSLALNTGLMAGCSRRETAIGRRWLGAGRAVYVPNVAQVGHITRRPVEPARGPLVVGMGRVCPQKDPAWFADAMVVLRQFAPDVRTLWIGGGAPEDEWVLRRSGIELTQWRDRTVGLQTLARADCYLHSAAWEGFPMTVLEAVALGIPVVIRRLPSEPTTPAAVTAADAAHAARLVHRVLTDGNSREANLSDWQAFLHENDRGTQSERLSLAYGTGQRAGRPRVRPRSLTVAVTERLEQGLRAVSLLTGGTETGIRWT